MHNGFYQEIVYEEEISNMPYDFVMSIDIYTTWSTKCRHEILRDVMDGKKIDMRSDVIDNCPCIKHLKNKDIVSFVHYDATMSHGWVQK